MEIQGIWGRAEGDASVGISKPAFARPQQARTLPLISWQLPGPTRLVFTHGFSCL